MANSTTEELGGNQENESWNGDGEEVPALREDPEPIAMTREEADGASSTSSSGNAEKDQKPRELGLDEYLDDIIASNSILEELCRLQLNSGLRKDEVPLSEDPKHRLCMPKLKLDKLDDLWLLGDPKESETKTDDVYDLQMLRNVNFTLDVFVSEAIFSDTFQEFSDKMSDLGLNRSSSSSSSSSNSCDCESCETSRASDRMEADEIGKLRLGWIKLKKGIAKIYVMVYKNEWNDPDQIAERPDLSELREILVKLMKKTPFILTLKLQETLQTLIQEVKLALHNTLKEDSKSPTLACNLVSDLIDNYDRIRTACNVSAPIFVDLENEYLNKFSVTWDLINKHMYHSVVASDPVLVNNLPICVSQLRKSFPDKSVESRNFALVRRYLDFDVDMGNVASLWETTGATLTKAKFEETVRSAQDSALKDDWEKYVDERKRIEKRLGAVCAKPSRDGKRSSDVSLSADTEAGDASSSHKERQSLSSTFPSILTAEGPKNPATWRTEELPEVKEHNQPNSSLKDVQPQSTGLVPSLSSLAAAVENRTDSKMDVSNLSKSASSCTDRKSTSPAPNSTASNSAKPKTKKSSTEIKQLFQQHYCSHKNKKKHPIPSAGAIRKGKVPPPPTCVLGDDDSTDELSEDSSSIAQDDTCSSASSMASHNPNGAKQCSCCYCEFLGHNPNGSTTQSVAPVSRNYTAMRERLRLLLNKKKRNKQVPQVAQTVQPQPQQIQTPKPTQPVSQDQESSEKQKMLEKLHGPTYLLSNDELSMLVASSPAMSSAYEKAKKRAQASASQKVLKGKDSPEIRNKEVPPTAKPVGAQSKPAKVCNDHHQLTSSAQSVPQKEDVNLSNQMKVNKTPCDNQEKLNTKPPRAATPGPNSQKRSQSATTLGPSKISSTVLNQLEKSQSAVASQSNGNPGGLINLMDVNELVDFIEGTGTCNEKRRAKKERQKLQRIEIIRANEREARIKREAEEAERRRREEEERAQQERERQLMKKQKKKAAQKAKKALEKGLPCTDGDEETEKESQQTPKTGMESLEQPVPDTGLSIEELRARQERELYELLSKHRLQLAEKEKKHLESLSSDTKSKKSKKGSKKNANAANPTMPSLSSTLQLPQQQGTQKQSKQQAKLSQNSPLPQGQLRNQQQQLPMFEPKPTQIKIQRSVDGVNFIPIYDNGEPATTNRSMFTQSFLKAPGTPSPSIVQHGMNSMFSQQKSSHPVNSLGFPPPSSKGVEPNQPFVTIKRVSDPTASEETVTISSYDKEKKLLYTLVNGEIHRAEGAPENLLPKAKPWTPELVTRLPAPNMQRFSEQFSNAPQGQRPPLPTDSEGKLDLGRLQLPPGISITKIQGPVPERKFFPEHEQNSLPLNGALNQSSPTLNLPSHAGYTATEGLPSSLSGPNVILVDASTLPTREEERLEMERLKGGESVGLETPVSNPMTRAYPYMAPKFHDDNGYKKPTGPQYLIKNVNGNVTFTPIPGPTETDATNYLDNNRGFNRNFIETPRATKQRPLPGETFDDFNSIFAPKDVDMGEIDEDEREIEAFKRFCFDSIPLQQKPKVNFDMKNLTVKKK